MFHLIARDPLRRRDSMTLPSILVTGGTGALGRQMVERLREARLGLRPPGPPDLAEIPGGE
jgi:hypothetical protein